MNFELHFQALEIILGGTVAVFLFLTPKQTFKDLFRLLFSRTVERNPSPIEIEQFLKDPFSEIEDPYSLFAQARDLWQMKVSPHLFEETLIQQSEIHQQQYRAALCVLKNLAKYPPALGMICTVMGLLKISTQTFLSSPNTQSVSAQLAFALSSTLYGLLVSHLFILPWADRLETKDEERKFTLAKTLNLLLSAQRRDPNSVSRRVIHAA